MAENPVDNPYIRDGVLAILFAETEDYDVLVQLSVVDRSLREKAIDARKRLFGRAEPAARQIYNVGKKLGDKVGASLGIPTWNLTNKIFEEEWTLLVDPVYSGGVTRLLTNPGEIDLLTYRCFSGSSGNNPTPSRVRVANQETDKLQINRKTYTLFERVVIVILLYVYYYDVDDPSDKRPYEKLMKKYAADLRGIYYQINASYFAEFPAPTGKTQLFEGLDRQTKIDGVITHCMEKITEDLRHWLEDSDT